MAEYITEIGRGVVREVDPSIAGRQMEEVRVLVEVEDLSKGQVVRWEIRDEDKMVSIYIWVIEDGWTRDIAQKVFNDNYEEVKLI